MASRDVLQIAEIIGSSKTELYSISNNIDANYRKAYIPKRDGTKRELTIPNARLKFIQSKIVDEFLSRARVSKYAMAYRSGSSVQKNAAQHVRKKKIFKLDIHKFFDNIKYSDVKKYAFPAEQFSEDARVLLSILCYHKNGVPQGAPTSPAISNIIMYDFDEKVGAWCRSKGISYTRYCDDMTFSGSFNEVEVKFFVEDALESMGLYLNAKKTAVITNGKRQTVTGIVVNKKLNVTKEYRRQIRQEVHYIRTYGLDSHMRRTDNFEDKLTYLRGLLGRIAFVLQTTPANYNLIDDKNYIQDLLKDLQG